MSPWIVLSFFAHRANSLCTPLWVLGDRRPLEDERLSCVIPGKIGCATGVLRKTRCQERRSAFKKLMRLGQERSGFWLHKSTPSSRISCIKGVRSS